MPSLFTSEIDDGAIVDLSETAICLSATAFSHYYRGRALSQKGDVDGAITDFTEALRFEPNNSIYLNRTGRGRAKAGRELQEALSDCNAAIRVLNR